MAGHFDQGRCELGDYCFRYGAKPTEYLYDLYLSGDPQDIQSDLSGNLDLYWKKAENSLIEIFVYENQMETGSIVYMKLEFQSKCSVNVETKFF